MVTHPLARVTGRRDETRVSSKPVGALECRDVTHADQELCPEDRSHAWQTNENPSPGTGEKTPPDLLVDALDSLLEGEHLRGELRNDARGYLLCRQANTLGSDRAKCLMSATLSEPLTERILR